MASAVPFKSTGEPQMTSTSAPPPAQLATIIPALGDTPLDGRIKGIPLGAALSLSEISEQRWNVARGDLSLPILTLNAAALHSNIETMQDYCRRQGVRLAPHGKTTMAPQLFAAQLSAGAWAITAATPTQLATMRHYGIGRILLANELVEASALRWLAAELARDPEFEFICLVDSVATVRAMESLLAEAVVTRPVQVLIEIGAAGGRAGARSPEAALEVGRAVNASRQLSLAGVEAYEGTLTSAVDEHAFGLIDELFAAVRSSVTRLAEERLFERDDVIVSAGGSLYFDRVIASLSQWPELAQPVTLVLRSGCYVSQDGGEYNAHSPLAGRRDDDEPLQLRNALSLWATVLSRPEPDTVIVGAGRRDLGIDDGLPTPRWHLRAGTALDGLSAAAEVYKVMDQHLFIRVTADYDIEPGDTVVLDVSHPCTNFDKFRFLPVIDDNHDVVDGILTFF